MSVTTVIIILLAGFFLPLFPMSMVFNDVFRRLKHPALKSALLLVWPQIGLLLLQLLEQETLQAVLPWAVLSALLYGFRLLAQREMQTWIAFLATSAWSLLWIPAAAGTPLPVVWYALSFSVPLLLLLSLARLLEIRFGAAYAGLFGGLALTMPRYSGVLVFTLLAATAVPLFPAFFTLLKSLTLAPPWIAVVTAIVWLLWNWAAILLLQGLIVGKATATHATDISTRQTQTYVLGLVLLAVAGIYLTGGLA